jgi:hypothetical protein
MLLLLTDVASMASLSVHTITLVVATFVDANGGVIETKLGRVVSATADVPVVKLNVTGAAAFPARSCSPFTVTEYTVLGASRLDGLKINAVRSPLALTLPVTVVPPPVTTNGCPMPTVSIASLNCTITRAFTATPLAPFAGLVAASSGATVSVPCAVVNTLDPPMIPRPATSVIPFVNHLIWYCVDAASGPLHVALNPSADAVIALAARNTPSWFRVICSVPLFTLIAFTRSLNCNRTTVFVPTPPALFAGSTAITDGRIRSASIPVVKLVVTGASSAFAARSNTPATRTVYAVFTLNGFTGVNVNVRFPLLSVRTTTTCPAPLLNVT